MQKQTQHPAIVATQTWLSSVIIQYEICPFAKPQWEADRIRLVVDEGVTPEECLAKLIIECHELDNNAAIETTLLVYPDWLSHFDDYLDYLSMAEIVLENQGYEGTYQLASFHPEYCFEDASYDDPANYTNRSPFPVLHLLRESSISLALANYPNAGESIPKKNIDLTRHLGLAKMQAMLAACHSKSGQ
ncbi:MAG: DUF1415 domain-containing protein [Methylococcaceae bacterium]|jgi:hypothetical protein